MLAGCGGEAWSVAVVLCRARSGVLLRREARLCIVLTCPCCTVKCQLNMLCVLLNWHSKTSQLTVRHVHANSPVLTTPPPLRSILASHRTASVPL